MVVIAPGQPAVLAREIFLHPDLTQRLHSGQGPEGRRCLSTIHGVQQCIAVGLNDFSQCLPLGGTFGQAGMRQTWPITLKPRGLGMPAEPVRRRDGQLVERGSIASPTSCKRLMARMAPSPGVESER